MATMSTDLRELRAEEVEHFRFINEKSVDDISLDVFYKPHTITLLTVSVLGLLYAAFTRDDNVQSDNIWTGLCAVLFFFLVISVLAFPNGPFTRPHPAIWRMVFGMSVFYFIFLVFVLFQTRKDFRRILEWLYPELEGITIEEKEYAANCSEIDLPRIVSHLDCFATAHFLGWITKAVLIRHYGILWTISIQWEITEMAFCHLLPNFAECWWDAWILDVLVCNGLGIWIGMYLCKKLEMRNYHWESIKDIHTTTGKLRRIVLQFTPVSWSDVKWLDPLSSYRRVAEVCLLIIVWQLSELNTFFLKHVMEVPQNHNLNVWRLFLICMVSAPTIRQYYVYVTDRQCKRLGTQCWMFCAITLTEAIICLKFGTDLFKQTDVVYVMYWFLVQLIGSIICVYLCAVYAKNLRWTSLEDGFFVTDSEATQDSSTPKKVPKISNGNAANGYNLRKRQQPANGNAG
ncbi:phosphatidylserine synthase 1-like [Pecten maximus]|uniref:phosphatidylserine synthase 1-like n=1 Tax=Pecten maximus TaxID=6579 RepID=UPI0014589A91|nr:phosphatidylserine synthase 1-like [Pecten maximus]